MSSYLKRFACGVLALLVYMTMVIAVRTSHFNVIRPILTKKKPPRREASLTELKVVHRAVERAAKVIPGSTCLINAAVGKILLNMLGTESVLRVGVAGDDRMAEVSAHAWLTAGPRIVIGGPPAKVAKYRQITTIP